MSDFIFEMDALAAFSGSPSSPSGPAGGDLSGTYPNPLVKALAITAAKVAAANKDGLANVPSMRTLGTGAQQATAGDDPRLDSIDLTRSFFVDGGVALTGDGTLNNPYKTVQEAINASTPTDANRYAIYIAPGKYLEQVTLKPFITFWAEPDTVIIQNDTAEAIIAPSSMGGFGCNINNIIAFNGGTGIACRIQAGGSIAFNGGVCSANDSEGIIVEGSGGSSGFLQASALSGFFSTSKSACKLIGTAIGIFNQCQFYTGNPGSFYDLEAGASTTVKYSADNDFQNRRLNLLGTVIFISYGKDVAFDNTGTGLSSTNVQDALVEIKNLI